MGIQFDFLRDSNQEDYMDPSNKLTNQLHKDPAANQILMKVMAYMYKMRMISCLLLP